MVGIYGLGGIAEPASTKTVQGPNKGTDVQAADLSAHDEVEISPEAAKASEVATFLAKAEEGSEVRTEKIRQAQENLQQGTYRIQEVLLQVAGRIAGVVG